MINFLKSWVIILQSNNVTFFTDVTLSMAQTAKVRNNQSADECPENTEQNKSHIIEYD